MTITEKGRTHVIVISIKAKKALPVSGSTQKQDLLSTSALMVKKTVAFIKKAQNQTRITATFACFAFTRW